MSASQICCAFWDGIVRGYSLYNTRYSVDLFFQFLYFKFSLPDLKTQPSDFVRLRVCHILYVNIFVKTHCDALILALIYQFESQFRDDLVQLGCGYVSCYYPKGAEMVDLPLNLLVGPLDLTLRLCDLAINGIQLRISALAWNHIVLLSDIDYLLLQLDDVVVIRNLLHTRVFDWCLEYIQLSPQDVRLLVDFNLLLPELLAPVDLGRDGALISSLIRSTAVRCQQHRRAQLLIYDVGNHQIWFPHHWKAHAGHRLILKYPTLAD